MSADPAWQAAVASLVQRRIFERLSKLPGGVTIPEQLRNQLSYAPEKGGRLYWKGNMTETQELLLLSLSGETEWQRAAGGLVKRMRPKVRTQSVLQLQSRLLSSQNALRAAVQNNQNALDRFKVLLGLPPNLGLTVNQRLLKQFELIDPRILRMELKLEAFVEQWAKLDEADPDPQQLRLVLQGLRKLRDETEVEVIKVLQEDLKRVRAELPKRLRTMRTAEERGQVQADFARTEEDLRALFGDFAEVTRVLKLLESDFGGSDMDQRVRRNAPLTAGLGATGAAIPAQKLVQDVVPAMGALREEILRIARNAEAVQNSLRVELIMLADFDLTIEQTVKLALENRLDLKNARARVMDARRRVEIAANRLQAILNLRVEGDINTRPANSKPLDFRGRQSNFRVGVGFTAPLDLVNERNAYRDAQIAYQRERRSYMALEDAIKLTVRTSWRNLDLLKQNFETDRRSVRVSAAEFDRAVESTVDPGGQNQNPGLTLLNALNSVLGAQNRLIRNWIEYEGTRLNIYRDMGIMRIDPNGIWEDSYYQQGVKSVAPGSITPPPPSPGPTKTSANELRPVDERQPDRGISGVRHGREPRSERPRVRSVSHTSQPRQFLSDGKDRDGGRRTGARRRRVLRFPIRPERALRGQTGTP